MQTTLKAGSAALLLGLASQAGAATSPETEPSFSETYLFTGVIADQANRAAAGIGDMSRDLYDKTVNAANSIYGPVERTVQDLADWKSMEDSAADEEFKDLTRRLGFELRSVNVGLEFLPKLGLSFERHTDASQLDPELDAQIDEHIASQPVLTSLDERVVFYTLKRIRDSERFEHVQELEVSILPLPGVEITYDINGVISTEKAKIEASFEKVLEFDEKLDALERALDELKTDASGAEPSASSMIVVE
jgi:hypothetical protein